MNKESRRCEWDSEALGVFFFALISIALLDLYAAVVGRKMRISIQSVLTTRAAVEVQDDTAESSSTSIDMGGSWDDDDDDSDDNHRRTLRHDDGGSMMGGGGGGGGGVGLTEITLRRPHPPPHPSLRNLRQIARR